MIDAWLDLVHGGGCVGCALPGRSLCRACRDDLPDRAIPVRPTPCPDGLAACFAAGEYDGVLRAMILSHKEHGTFSLATPLGRALAQAIHAALDPNVVTVLIPVPSRPGVVRSRGHNPVLRMTRAAARRLGSGGQRVRVVELLEQRSEVHDQAGLNAGERSANLTGSMVVRPTARAALARTDLLLSLVLCDDILTTGATAREAQRALEDSGLRVRAVTTVAATRKRVIPPERALPLSGSAD